MKKFYFIPILIGVLCLFTSCLRDEDLAMFSHPIHIQGEIDPHFGIPVAYGEMNFHDIIELLDDSYSGYVDPNAETITILYHMNTSDTISSTSSQKGKQLYQTRHNTGEDDTWVTADTTLTFDLPINIFQSVAWEEVINNDIAIDHFWLDISAFIKAMCPNEIANLIQQYAYASVNSIDLKYTDHQGTVHSFTDFSFDTIYIRDIIQGQSVSLNRIDLASIINSLPQNISATVNLAVTASTEIVSNLPYSDFEELLDSLNISQFAYNLDLDATIPFSVHIGDLPYNFVLDLEEGINTLNLDSIVHEIHEGIDVEIFDSEICLAIDNGIPIDLRLKATLLDENENEISVIFPDDTIKAAPVGPVEGNGTTYQAIGSTQTNLVATLNTQSLEDLSNAKKIKIDLGVSTNDNDQHVSIMKDDFLKLRAYVKLHPSATFDIPIVIE